jgi:hypothetical protein
VIALNSPGLQRRTYHCHREHQGFHQAGSRSGRDEHVACSILLIPPRFAGHEFRAIAGVIRTVAKDYLLQGLNDAVVDVLRK